MAESDALSEQSDIDQSGEDAAERSFSAESPFPPESTFAPPDKPADARAEQEAAMLAQGVDLEEDGKKQEHRRYQSFRNHINLALIFVFWIVAVSIMVGILIYAWHIVAPDKWKFLSEKGFNKLQTLLGSAVLSSALSGYVKQRME
jgi:hypothetical protein